MTSKEAELKRKANLIVYNAKHSGVTSLDSGWVEIYEPGLADEIVDLVNHHIESILDEVEKEVIGKNEDFDSYVQRGVTAGTPTYSLRANVINSTKDVQRKSLNELRKRYE